MHLDPKTTTSGHLAPSKFQEVHKKWSTGTQPQLDLDSDDHLENIYRKKVTSGATTVKNLTNRCNFIVLNSTVLIVTATMSAYGNQSAKGSIPTQAALGPRLSPKYILPI